jgi:hypothetical protein
MRDLFGGAEAADRKDILNALRPTLTEQMRLWWDLVSLMVMVMPGDEVSV